MYNVHQYSGAHGIIEGLKTADRVNSLTCINNQPTWKDTRTMQTPLLVLDAHVQAVSTNRLLEARRAELLRLARQTHGSPVARLIARLRRLTGVTLVSVGQRLQESTTPEIDAMSVTSTRASSS